MYNGYDWYGRIIEVREVRSHRRHACCPLTSWSQDRFAGLSGGRGRGRGRGGDRGFRGGGRGGFGGRGGGGYGGVSNADLYADYSGPDQQMGTRTDENGAGYVSGSNGGSAPGAGASAGPGGYGGAMPDPSQQIMVRNVSCFIGCEKSSVNGYAVAMVNVER